MSEASNHNSCPACNSWWRLPLLLAVVLAAIVFTLRRGGLEQAVHTESGLNENAQARQSELSVTLTIDFGDRRRPIAKEAGWREGMTVADLLNSDPPTNFHTTGSGAGTFLTELGGIANEGDGGSNWIYQVNGKHADRSFAVHELSPNDHVLWTFAAQQ